jgi:uncharacterized coiled-coil DUF342 family protein
VTTAEEKELMKELKVLDKVLMDLRDDLRYGENLSRISEELAAVKNA